MLTEHRREWHFTAPLNGGELVWQIGTGYFGCRDAGGSFSLTKLKENVDRHPQVRAIEIKLSQGAKAGVDLVTIDGGEGGSWRSPDADANHAVCS